MNTPHFFIFSGEPSGDLHGKHLIAELKKSLPACQISGVGGPLMRMEGLQNFLKMEDFAVMGFSDVFKALPSLIIKFIKVRNYILKNQPTAVILIDYPGFNLRLAQSLRKKGFNGKIIHYICPSVWAHGKKRISQMSNTLDLLLTIFPFEASYFEHTSLPVKYIGNPLEEYIRNYQYDEEWKKTLNLTFDKPLIAVFPGSRKSEIQLNLPKLLKSIQRLNKDNSNLCFGISCSSPDLLPVIEKALKENLSEKKYPIYLIPKKYSYELMRDSQSAIAKSGTVTLELALHNRPTVVVYELTRLNRFIAKYVMKLNLPFYCLVNILGKKLIFPELIESGFTPDNVVYHLKALIQDGPHRVKCLEECKKIQAMLGNKNVSQQAVNAIQELIK